VIPQTTGNFCTALNAKGEASINPPDYIGDEGKDLFRNLVEL
jgi:hypothetical protein